MVVHAHLVVVERFSGRRIRGVRHGRILYRHQCRHLVSNAAKTRLESAGLGVRAGLDRWAGVLWAPYVLWVSFATGLNFAIWRLNAA
jgi:hypothetical protein